MPKKEDICKYPPKKKIVPGVVKARKTQTQKIDEAAINVVRRWLTGAGHTEAERGAILLDAEFAITNVEAGEECEREVRVCFGVSELAIELEMERVDNVVKGKK
jgi:hypothetical protein